MLDTPTNLTQEFLESEGNTHRIISKGVEKLSLADLKNSRSVGIKEYVCDYLNTPINPHTKKIGKRLTYIDLFCGGGGLSLGVHHAFRQFGFDARLALAADIDKAALRLISHHFNPIVTRDQAIEDLVKFSVDFAGKAEDFITQPEIGDPQISQFKGKIDLLVGGPPCQGHSNLNNKTRRQDPRNLLYFLMPAFAVALDIPCLVIENVRSIKNANENVVPITRDLLRANGYYVNEQIITGTEFGVAQTRTRHFLIASKVSKLNLDLVLKSLKSETLSFDDINTNLPKLNDYPTVLQSPASLSDENVARIQHLHTVGEFNLENKLRPSCHQDGHTYPSVYGRLKGDEPSGTITTGFGSPGRGRYIHPHEPRMITPREAARLQSFPDWYFAGADQINLTRNNLYKIIGDAVPPLMFYPIAVALLESIQQIHSRKS